MEPERVGMIVLESIYGNFRIMVVLSLLCVGAAVAFAAESAGTSSLVTRTPSAASVQIPAYFERNEGQFPTPLNPP